MLSVLKNFEKVDPKKVTATAHFVNDLGLDSLDAVEVRAAGGNTFSGNLSGLPSHHTPPTIFSFPCHLLGLHGPGGGVRHHHPRCRV